MQTRTIPLVGGPIEFAGAVSLDADGQFVVPWRLPVDILDLFHDSLVERASAPAGVRLRFASDTGAITFGIEPSKTRAAFDLFVDGKLHQRIHTAETDGTIRFTDLPTGAHHLEIYLPHGQAVQLRDFAIDAGAAAIPWPDARPRWVVYGSSITQSVRASGPSEIWPAQVANRFGLNLTCLGFGGNCCLEPMVARVIRGLPADYISLCLGINVYNGGLCARTFRSAVIGLISIIRERHPVTPMAVVSPIFSPPRETTPGGSGMTLEDMRTDIAEAVERLHRRGDKHLHYVNGLEIFGPDHLAYLPDQLHPGAEGQRPFAEQYGKRVMSKLGLRAGLRDSQEFQGLSAMSDKFAQPGQTRLVNRLVEALRIGNTLRPRKAR